MAADDSVMIGATSVRLDARGNLLPVDAHTVDRDGQRLCGGGTARYVFPAMAVETVVDLCPDCAAAARPRRTRATAAGPATRAVAEPKVPAQRSRRSPAVA
jgi:hypothetical protein